MPTVAVIEGVKIQVLRGGLPKAKLAAVVSWAEPRRAVLLEAWEAVAANRAPGKIE